MMPPDSYPSASLEDIQFKNYFNHPVRLHLPGRLPRIQSLDT